MKEISKLNNEDGTVLILALIMLVLLTLIGISATTTSMIEIKIAGNERVYKRNLYSAEAAVMQCAQNMEQTNLQNPKPTWLGLIGTVNEPDDIRLTSFWEAPVDPTPQLGVIPGTLFVATSQGLAGISSRVLLYTIVTSSYPTRLATLAQSTAVFPPPIIISLPFDSGRFPRLISLRNVKPSITPVNSSSPWIPRLRDSWHPTPT